MHRMSFVTMMALAGLSSGCFAVHQNGSVSGIGRAEGAATVIDAETRAVNAPGLLEICRDGVEQGLPVECRLVNGGASARVGSYYDVRMSGGGGYYAPYAVNPAWSAGPAYESGEIRQLETDLAAERDKRKGLEDLLIEANE